MTEEEYVVYESVVYLSRSGRTGNTSQVANDARMPRTRVAKILAGLSARGYIKDVSKNAAYHWRTTGKMIPARHGGRPLPFLELGGQS